MAFALGIAHRLVVAAVIGGCLALLLRWALA